MIVRNYIGVLVSSNGKGENDKKLSPDIWLNDFLEGKKPWNVRSVSLFDYLEAFYYNNVPVFVLISPVKYQLPSLMKQRCIPFTQSEPFYIHIPLKSNATNSYRTSQYEKFLTIHTRKLSSYD